ncbi:MAG: undecaprenyl-diphosphatase UppP [Candidatus Moranbacteria bacterium]|nr:undecaprenyl-diphosphatase UppP [Candidatus Moranbacteria bacterium]
MTTIHAIIFGIIQGLGEFLPISSSAHLIIFPWLFKLPDPGLSFDVALHFGTLIAVVLFFWKDWLNIIARAFGFGEKLKLSAVINYPKNTLWLLVIATVPGAIFGFLFEKQAETIFRAPLLIAGTLTLAGLVLYWLDITSKKDRDFTKISPKNALLIGLSQAVAIIPGISRSGATISTGLALGFNRTSAARFSFLMSAPIIFGATILKFKELLHNFTSVEFVAILSAAITGYIAIAWMLKFIERISYKIFFWYRLAFALIIVLVFFWR